MKNHIEIYPGIWVFDDPEFCGSGGFSEKTELCMHDENTVCDIFRKGLRYDRVLDEPIKCEACKSAYNKAKEPGAWQS